MAFRKIADSTNVSNNCTAMSQLWLLQGMSQGYPQENLVSQNISSFMNSIRAPKRGGDGGDMYSMRSAKSLTGSGFSLFSTIEYNNVPLYQCIHHLLTSAPGWYYLSINSQHAMAAYVAPDKCLFYEPDSGLYEVPSTYSGAVSLAAKFPYHWQRVTAFKIYQVR